MSPTAARTHRTVADIQVAAIAATAARSVPGVARLQPGLRGLVQQLGREIWERLTGTPYPDVAGVDATTRGDETAIIDITLVTDGRRPAAATAADVQHTVTSALAAHQTIPIGTVAVHVCEISLPP